MKVWHPARLFLLEGCALLLLFALFVCNNAQTRIAMAAWSPPEKNSTARPVDHPERHTGRASDRVSSGGNGSGFALRQGVGGLCEDCVPAHAKCACDSFCDEDAGRCVLLVPESPPPPPPCGNGCEVGFDCIEGQCLCISNRACAPGVCSDGVCRGMIRAEPDPHISCSYGHPVRCGRWGATAALLLALAYRRRVRCRVSASKV
jgi:hypothetical protein